MRHSPDFMLTTLTVIAATRVWSCAHLAPRCRVLPREMATSPKACPRTWRSRIRVDHLVAAVLVEVHADNGSDGCGHKYWCCGHHLLKLPRTTKGDPACSSTSCANPRKEITSIHLMERALTSLHGDNSAGCCCNERATLRPPFARSASSSRERSGPRIGLVPGQSAGDHAYPASSTPHSTRFMPSPRSSDSKTNDR